MAVENLTSLGASVLGLVVNAVASDSSTRYGRYKSGYGGYSYRKGYHSSYYTYGYGYNYGYGHRSQTYYEDELSSAGEASACNGHSNGHSNGQGNGALASQNGNSGVAAAHPEKSA